MPENCNPPLLLSEEAFKTGTAAWLQQVTLADDQNKLLDKVFSATGQPDAAGRLLYFSIPADWVRWLTSTVGCTMVKARFLVNKGGQFNLVLYATDEQGKRVSAYYLVDDNTTRLGNILATLYGQAAGSPDSPAFNSTESGAVQIPHGVAGEWVMLWKEADTLLPAMFATQYGMLQGYNFVRGDLANNLFNVDPVEQQQLRVDFGLHKYYAHSDDGNTQPTYTFGLVLRLVNPDASTSDTPFYDMSTPCPPMH